MTRFCLILVFFVTACQSIQDAYEAFRETSSAFEAIEECRDGIADSCMELQTQVLEKSAKSIRIRAIAFEKEAAMKWANARAAAEFKPNSPERISEKCVENESKNSRTEETNRQIRKRDTAKPTFWTCICEYKK